MGSGPKISQGDVEKAMQGLNFEFGVDPSDPAQNSYSNQNGLSDQQRFVVQNLFDTQLDRRRGFLKQLGYEMSPDGENYRPLEHDGEFQPIDPGFEIFSAEKAIRGAGRGGFSPAGSSAKKLFSKEGLKELGRDFTDVGFDLGAGAFTGAAATAGGTIGGAAGTLVAPGVGTVVGGVGGAFVSGAAANAAAETLKMAIGDLYLDEDIPMNMKDLAFQSITSGLLSGGGQALGATLQKFQKMGAEKLKGAIAEAFARRSNGQMNPDIILDFMTHPQRYAPDVVKGATARNVDFVDNVFGTSVDHPRLGKSLSGGIHQKKMDSLNKRAELALEELSQNPDANFTVDEILNATKEKVGDLNRLAFRKSHEEAALKYLNKQIADTKAKYLVKPEGIDPFTKEIIPAEYDEIPFEEARQLLSKWQDATFKKGQAATKNPIVAQIAHELRVKADDKATKAGSNFAAINAQRNEILTARDGLLDVAKGNDFYNAYLGKNKESKIRVQRALAETDRVLDTRLQEGAETTQFQKVVENMYETPSAFGSGGELIDAARGGLQAGAQASVTGSVVGRTAGNLVGAPGTGARVGSVILSPLKAIREAKVRGSFASPDILVKNVSKINSRIDGLSQPKINPGAVRSAAGQAGQQTESTLGLEPAPQPVSTAPTPEELEQALQGLKFDFAIPEKQDSDQPADVNARP